MKGVFINNQFEFRVEVKGDSFTQGSSVPVTFSVKNHAASKRAPGNARLALALVDQKKARAKSPDALAILNEATCQQWGELTSGEQKEQTWSFDLPCDCCISDTSQSLAIVYGNQDPGVSQHLPLQILPHTHIDKVLSLFESPFQFEIRSKSSKQGWVEAKMRAPKTQRLLFLEELLVQARFDNERLNLRYNFKLKSIDTSNEKVGIKKRKALIEQELLSSEFMLTQGHIRNELIESKIDEALASISSGV